MSVGEVVVNLPTLPHPAAADEMTPRAQVYLLAGAVRHLVIGLFCLFGWQQFSAAAFIPIINTVPLWMWGGGMVSTAVMLSGGALLRNRTMARVGLIMSAAVTAALAAGLWLGAYGVWSSGGRATPITATLLTVLVAKDLAVCADPMKTPLELTSLWRRVVDGGAR